jgi:hypothetical protein
LVGFTLGVSAMSPLSFQLYKFVTRSNVCRHLLGDLRERLYELKRRSAGKGYSQHGEDLWLWKFFRESNEGFYVDIGASSPIRLSNTYLFYKAGWAGITVDPIQSLCLSHKRLRPRDTNYHCGVGCGEGLSCFYELIPSVLSTFDETCCQSRMDGGAILRGKYEIPVRPLSAILSSYFADAGERQIDFLTVDVEGLDELVLRSNDWDRYRPRLVVYECNDPDRDTVASFLASCGYAALHDLGCNRIFVSE